MRFGTALLLVSICTVARSRESFDATLYVTAHGKELFHAWEHPGGKPFSIVPVKIAPRGEILSGVVLFKNCQPAADGNCNSTVEITAYDPAGGVYGKLPAGELWVARVPPREGHSQLGVTYMGLVIEPEDPKGTYRLVAVARDLVSGTIATSEASFIVE